MEAAALAVTTSSGSPVTLMSSLLVLALGLYCVYFRLKRRRLLQLAERLPGNPGWPLIGNALEFLGNGEAVFKSIYATRVHFAKQSVLKWWLGPKLIVFLYNPKDVQLVLGSNTLIDKSDDYELFHPWLGQGLLTSSGEKWRNHRKLIAPAFHMNVLKTFIDVFNVNSRAVVEKMRKEEGGTFDVHHYMSECTVEILLETAMGVTKEKNSKSGIDYAMAVIKMCDLLHFRQTNVWLKPEWVFALTKFAKEQIRLLDVIHSLTKKVIKTKKEEISKGQQKYITDTRDPTITPEKKANGLKDDLDDQDENDVGDKKRLAFLDLMIETAQDGLVLSEIEIKEQVDTIMFEGHDTTTAASSFFLSLMGIHEDVQEKVIEELDGIFGDSDRPVTFQDTQDMKYLERCILETLRMYPPVPIIARKITKEVQLSDSDMILPVGCTAVVGTYLMHHNDQIYDNPEVFNPDNFLPEKTIDRHYYAFVPFSAGPRSCVGRKYAMLKLKIILATVMRSFRVKSDFTEKDFRLEATIILKRVEGFMISLKPR